MNEPTKTDISDALLAVETATEDQEFADAMRHLATCEADQWRDIALEGIRRNGRLSRMLGWAAVAGVVAGVVMGRRK